MVTDVMSSVADVVEPESLVIVVLYHGWQVEQPL